MLKRRFNAPQLHPKGGSESHLAYDRFTTDFRKLLTHKPMRHDAEHAVDVSVQIMSQVHTVLP